MLIENLGKTFFVFRYMNLNLNLNLNPTLIEKPLQNTKITIYHSNSLFFHNISPITTDPFSPLNPHVTYSLPSLVIPIIMMGRLRQTLKCKQI